MPSPLLATKLYIPRLRPETVPRGDLVERLKAGLEQTVLQQGLGFARKLTLISAPAGFGKTTLLSECIPHCGLLAAWLSLDGDDNEPARFWTYVIAALQTVYDWVGEPMLATLQAAQVPPARALLPDLINDVARIDDPLVLVLDDFHLIVDPVVHDGVTFLLDNLPPQMHLVLASRSDPPWPLARLRARGELNELRAPDLRFTPEEAAAFLNDVMGLGLSPENIADLDTRIEGWIAGLQMAAISMKARKQSQGAGSVSQFIKSLTGSHRFILDYLVEEVLELQPRSIQSFLLKTSILERLCAPLCDAVTGANGDLSPEKGDSEAPGSLPTQLSPSQHILEHLEAANLFVIPLDDERHWYRYHHLFADLLCSRLEHQTGPQGLQSLHTRASGWYEENGMVAKAVRHALAANDFDRVARLVEVNALSLIYHVELTSIVRWLGELPSEVLISRPWLTIAHAWALVYAGQFDAVEARLRIAQESLANASSEVQVGSPATGHLPDKPEDRVGQERGGVEAEERERIAGHIAAIRAYALMLKGDMSRSASLSHEALDRLPDHDARARSFAMGTLGAVLTSSGDFEGAAQRYMEAMRLSQAIGDRHLSVVVLTEMANLHLVQGQLKQAADSCQQALQLAEEEARQTGQPMPVAAYAHANLSLILHEWNDLREAIAHAREGVALCKKWGQRTIQPFCYRTLAIVLQASGDEEAAFEAIGTARQIASTMSPWIRRRMEAWETRIRLAQGDIARAVKWVQEEQLQLDLEADLRRQASFAIAARVYVAQGELDQALELLARLQAASENAGAMGNVIKILALQAVALQAKGQGDQAFMALERALSLAEAGGYVRTFIEEGAPMAELLRQSAARGAHPAYARDLLLAFDTVDLGTVAAEKRERLKDKAVGLHPVTPPLDAQPLIEPLTEREMDVLRLLNTRLSIAEIAEELIVAVSTVRSHTKSIYGKLDVHSRMEAVRRAEEIGLL